MAGGDDKRSASKDAGEGKVDAVIPGETPIQNMYSFWYIKRNTGNKAESYEKSIKEIGEFKTTRRSSNSPFAMQVQGFWRIYNHLMRPNDLPNTMDYHLFKTGIKPMWEDGANRRGGKWMVRLRKGIASRYWEDLVLAIVGEQFDVGNEICGAVISVRYNEDIISLWNRNADNNEALYRIRDTMRKVLNLPQFIALEYKRHDASLTDNSSFRNTTLWRSDSKTGGDGNTGGQNAGEQRRSMHRSSSGSNQKDSSSGGNRGERGDRGDRGESSGSGRFSRDKFEKQSSGGQSRSGWRDSSKRPFFSKSNSSASEDHHEGGSRSGNASDRSSSMDNTNAWQQK
ncbi:Eukaryotic initiation factor 4e, partial [Globisporangium splendens]